MSKNDFSKIRNLYRVGFEIFLGDQADWFRFWLFLGVMIGFTLIGLVLDQSILGAFRWGMIPVSSLVIGLLIGASYVQDIYELESYGACFTYLWASVFGFPLPVLIISAGKINLDVGKVNVLSQIGGPGMLLIEPGNVVVLETLYAPSRILGSGEHRIFRFETIKEVVSLEEQFGKIGKINAVTRDGIDVTVENVTYGFCVFQDNQKKTPENPYPFSVTGVRKRAYGRSAGENGELASWADAVQGVIKGVIVDHISKNDLDALTAPNILEGHPLDKLRLELNSTDTRKALEKIGAQLEWHNIGNLTANSAEVDIQRLNAWIVRQTGKAKIIRAQGESENLASQERGRAEGQVVLLKSIAQALQDINLSDDADDAKTYKNLRNIVLARTAQVLESMTSVYKTSDKENGKDDNQAKL